MSSLMDPIKGAGTTRSGGSRSTLEGRQRQDEADCLPAGVALVDPHEPVSGTPYCMHTHLGFSPGRNAGVYEDGCEYESGAAIRHRRSGARHVGRRDEPAVFIRWTRGGNRPPLRPP